MTNDTQTHRDYLKSLILLFAVLWGVTLVALFLTMGSVSAERAESAKELSRSQALAESCHDAAESYRESTILLTESISAFVGSQFLSPLDLTPALESVNAGDESQCLVVEK